MKTLFVTSEELLDGLLGCFGRRDVHELVDVVDDVGSDEDVAPEVAAVDAADGDWRTIELVVRQLLRGG